MAERKVLNKYYAPNFDSTLLQRKKKRQSIKDKMFNIRYMLPMSMRCNTCGAYAPIGTKYNMRVEKVKDERYLGIAIFRFYFKCLLCYAQISFKTDPKTADYVVDEGATRNYECYKDMQAAEEQLKDQRENEEEGNAMKSLENKTFDSKREMEILDAIDNIKHLNKRQNQITYDQLIELVQNNLEEDDSEEISKGFNEEDDKLLNQLYLMKRQKLLDDNDDEAEESENKKSTVEDSQQSDLAKIEDSVDNNDIVEAKSENKKNGISNDQNQKLSNNNNFFKNKPKIMSIQKQSSNENKNTSISVINNNNGSLLKNNNLKTNNQKPVIQNKGLLGYDSDDE